MQVTKIGEPFVNFVDHCRQFYGPYSPRSAAQSARSVPILAPHTKAVFAMFHPDAHIRLTTDWMDNFETTNGVWGGHIALAWRAGGQWLFAARSGLAVLDNQPGFFDWVRFEQRRRRFPEMKKALESLYLPSPRLLGQLEQSQDKPVSPSVPILLELWVVINMSAKPVEIRGSFNRLWGRAEIGEVMSFLVWEAGRHPLYVKQSKRQAGQIDAELRFVPSPGCSIKATILRLPKTGDSLETLGDVTWGKGSQLPAAPFSSVFDRLVLVLVESS